MKSQTRISLHQFCDYVRVDFKIVREFAEFGLCPVIITDNDIEIETRNLQRLKKIVNLHKALGINKEGIEIILSLEEQVGDLQKEVEILQGELKKMRLHEGLEKDEKLKRRGLLIEIDDPFTTSQD